MKPTVLLGILGLTVQSLMRASAQDVHVSQFTETPLLRNPALAGLFRGDYRAYALFRSQWQSVGVPFRTVAAGTDFKFPIGRSHDYLSAGVSLMYDEVGMSLSRQTQTMPVVNFHKSIDEEHNRYLSLGFAAGLATRGLNTQRMTFNNQFMAGSFQPTAPTGERSIIVSRTYLDMAVGMVFNSSIGKSADFFLGASYWHFNQKASDLNGPSSFLNPKLQLNGGLKTFLGKRLSLHTEANWLRQGTQQQLMAAALFRYHVEFEEDPHVARPISISAGMAYRNGDALVPIARLRIASIEGSISYDINVSQLMSSSQSRGGYELTLSYKGFTSGDRSSLLQSRCPSF